MKNTPKYPVYVPSKGRFDHCLTAKFLLKDKVPFQLVVEEQEADEYIKRFGKKHVLILPFSNLGSVIPCRNWMKEYSASLGYERHWQLDDNMIQMMRWYKGKRVPCDAGTALRVAEDFTDRYKNIAVSGLNYTMFAITRLPPFFLNCHVYSCSLINNKIPHKWRGLYNEDTDMCLQVLADGWCTVLINAFLCQKIATMIMTGGNTSEIYHGDGRLKMAKSLERLWPGVVETKRRFQRPQHVVANSWRKFDTPLILKDGIDLSKMKPNEYGLKLKAVGPVKSKYLQKMVRESNRKK